MLVHLLRHARTLANERGMILGDSDPPASPAGLAEFVSSAGRLRGRGVRRVFTSPLLRARQSAGLLGRMLGAPVLVEPGLAELSAGEFQGRPRLDVVPDGGPLRREWSDRPPGGESHADAESRVALALSAVLEAARLGPVAVIGHAAVNRVILKLLTDAPTSRLLALDQPHGLAAVLVGGFPGRFVHTNVDRLPDS